MPFPMYLTFDVRRLMLPIQLWCAFIVSTSTFISAVENNSRLTLSPPIFPTSKPQVRNDSIILSATFKSFHDDFESVKQELTLITKKNPLELHELIMISLCQGLENQGFMNLRACQTRDHQWNHLRYSTFIHLISA